MRRTVLLALLLATAGTACGASIQAVYEGDVRFEHCMALDSRQDVKPTLRSACWEEWVKFYTFGQNRDRVEYAKIRQKQLSTTSNFEDADTKPAVQAAVPDPTSVLAPPPRILVSDAGAPSPPEVEDAGADAEIDAAAPPPPPGTSCAADCDTTWTGCRTACKTPACEKTCTATYKRCMRKCFQ